MSSTRILHRHISFVSQGVDSGVRQLSHSSSRHASITPTLNATRTSIQRCSRHIPPRHNAAIPASRTFSSSPIPQKKGGKPSRDEKHTTAKESVSTADDPSDFSVLEADIAAAIDKLKNDLSKLRAGGRFNPEVLENLRVQVEKGSGKTVKLSDVAQVIPKGRTVQVMVGEQDHLKPISSTISSSSLSLTPQPDPTGANPLLLTINIPPPTADSRRAAVDAASKAGEKAGMAIRDARGRQQKKLRAMSVAKAARPDDLKKAGAGMEKVVERGSGEVKRVVEGARKGIESG